MPMHEIYEEDETPREGKVIQLFPRRESPDRDPPVSSLLYRGRNDTHTGIASALAKAA